MFTTKKEKKPEPIVALYLRDDGGGVVVLMAENWTIAELTNEGLRLVGSIPADVDIPVDEDGRIKLVQ